MSLPRPETGLVIRYSYLWLREHRQGREEGVKDRPCAIIFAADTQDGETEVLVLPVTHSPPASDASALEIPAALKHHLGLDSERSWVVYSESNAFTWPGPDLRRVGERDNSSVAYGMLPPRFFAELKQRFIDHELTAKGRRVTRTE